MNVIFQILVYTFAIFGIIVFIQETTNFFKSQYFGKVILILEDEENIEQILRDYSKAVKHFKNTYIFYKGNDYYKEEIINLFCEKNLFLVRINKDGYILSSNNSK